MKISRGKRNWSRVPDGCLIPRRTGRLTVGSNLTPTSTSWEGFVKYAIEMGSSTHQVSAIQELSAGGYRNRQTIWSEHTPNLFFQNKENRLKISMFVVRGRAVGKIRDNRELLIRNIGVYHY
jgi:hypothetical protein